MSKGKNPKTPNQLKNEMVEELRKEGLDIDILSDDLDNFVNDPQDYIYDQSHDLTTY